MLEPGRNSPHPNPSPEGRGESALYRGDRPESKGEWSGQDLNFFLARLSWTGLDGGWIGRFLTMTKERREAGLAENGTWQMANGETDIGGAAD